MHILHGLERPNPTREEHTLSSFWKEFAKLHPNHEVFTQASLQSLNLKRTVPLLVHGDEGRGRRRVAHFALSFHSVLGKGIAKHGAIRKRKRTRLECNFDGHTYTNRFVIATLRKRDYTRENSDKWPLLLDTLADESRFMWEVGIDSPYGGRYWGAVLNVIGDWPFLHKCGGFSRSFNSIQKRVTIRRPPAGICHLCRAGQADCQFEQLATRRPGWIQTLYVEDPFVEPSSIAANLLKIPGEEPGIWAYDWFHTMHLGVLKYYLGSVLALLSDQEAHGQIDERFGSLTQDYKQWCLQNKRRCHVASLTKEKIGWEKRSQYPAGMWHKGALSTVLMVYVEARFTRQRFDDVPLLKLAGEACFAIQRCSRTLYRSGLFLEPEVCQQVAEQGLQFLRRYSQMATLAKSRGECFFIYQPKLHCLHHFMIDLFAAHQRGLKGMNPLARSCQQSEDIIGRASRLSRRVTGQNPVLHRVLDRYLQSTYHHFISCGFLVRPKG